MREGEGCRERHGGEEKSDEKRERERDGIQPDLKDRIKHDVSVGREKEESVGEEKERRERERES